MAPPVTGRKRSREEAERAEPPPLRVSNIVATMHIVSRATRLAHLWKPGAQTRAALNLPQLTLRIPGCEYDSCQFSASILRLAGIGTTALLFATANAVCTGARDMAATYYAVCVYMSILTRHGGLAVDAANVRVQNMVCSADAGFLINQLALWKDHQLNCPSFQPDVFPALIFRLGKPSDVVFLLFRSGKAIVTGARDYASAARVWNEFFTSKLRYYADAPNSTSNSAEYRACVAQSVGTDVPVTALAMARASADML